MMEERKQNEKLVKVEMIELTEEEKERFSLKYISLFINFSSDPYMSFAVSNIMFSTDNSS